MKPVLDTLKSKFDIEESDEFMFAGFLDEYKRQGLSEDDSLLFAKLTFLLTNKTVVDHLLKSLDEDIKQLWAEEIQNPDVTLELHKPDEYLQLFGLSWPLPEEKLAGNHSHHLLSRVLLQMECRHGLNVDDSISSPVPTFLGVITEEDAKEILNSKMVWNDDPRTSGIFFHGKMLHRIQFYLIMAAIDSGLLDLKGLSMSGLIHKLINTKISAYEPSPYDLAWNFIIDFNISDINVDQEMRMRNLEPLREFFPPTINGCVYDKEYLFGCDPYFMHSYLMTASRVNTPYLSECVTQTYCRSAFAIKEMEREIGEKEQYEGYYKDQQTDRRKLTRHDLAMENVLRRQEQSYATYGVHAVKYDHVLERQKKTGKSQRINKRRSRPSGESGFIQFRSLFKNASDDASNREAVPTQSKRMKI